jgi:hypothetical protein
MLGKSIKKVIKATAVASCWLLLIAGLNYLIDFDTLFPEVQIALLCLFAFISLVLGGVMHNILNQE